MKQKCAIIIPIHNEEKSIKNILTRTHGAIKKISKYDMSTTCINDGSTDNTKQILNRVKDIMVIHNTHRLGYGASIKRGINSTKSDWIIIIDCDGTYPPELIPPMLAKMNKGYDMIIASRKGNNLNCNRFRVLGRKIFKMLVYLKTGYFIRDINSGMRAFKRKDYQKLRNSLSDGFSFTTTLSFEISRRKLKIGHIPIHYSKRHGKSKFLPLDYIRMIHLFFSLLFR